MFRQGFNSSSQCNMQKEPEAAAATAVCYTSVGRKFTV